MQSRRRARLVAPRLAPHLEHRDLHHLSPLVSLGNVAWPTAQILDNWFWTPAPPGRDVLSGEIFDDLPPRSWPDGAGCETSNVSELEQRGAAEGTIIVTMTGRRYLLGKAATHASLAAERDDAQREADALQEQLEALLAAQPAVAAGLTQNKRPRGRAPAATAGTSRSVAG